MTFIIQRGLLNIIGENGIEIDSSVDRFRPKVRFGGPLEDAVTIVNGQGNSLVFNELNIFQIFSTGSTSSVSISPNTMNFTSPSINISNGLGSNLSMSNPQAQTILGGKSMVLTTSVDGILLTGKSGISINVDTAGEGAKYVTIPTILDDETIPAWKNVDDLLSTPSWEQKSDTQYTTGSRFAVTGGAASVVLPNNGLSVINTYMPPGISFYDETTQKITPQNIGEVYEVRVNFKAESGSTNNYIALTIDIGNGTPVVILEKTLAFPRGSGVEHSFSETILVYALGTFVANGGQIKIESSNNCDVWDIAYVTTKITASNIDIADAPSDSNDYVRNNSSWIISESWKPITLTTGNVDISTTYKIGDPQYYGNSASTLGGALPESYGTLVSYFMASGRLHQYYYPKNKAYFYLRSYDFDGTNAFTDWIDFAPKEEVYDLNFKASANAPLSLAESIYGLATLVGTENKAGQVTGVSYYGSTDGGDTFALVGGATGTFAELGTWLGANSGASTFLYLKASMITTSTQLQVVNVTYTKS